MRPKRSWSTGVSLSLVSALAISTLPGCGKLEELTGGKKEETEAKPEDAAKKDGEPKADGGETKTDAAKPEEVAKVEPPPAPVEPIPVAPMHTGLDLMLSMVPEGADFMIARDATVLADYVEEGTRFLDGPMATLQSGQFAGDADLMEMKAGFDELKLHTDKVKVALETSGIDLAQGAAFVESKSGDKLVIYQAANANALPELGTATGEEKLAALKCKSIEGVEGFNVCSKEQKSVDDYKPTSDPAPLRALLTEKLPGVELDEANLVMHFYGGEPKEMWASVSTIPGSVELAASVPNDPELAEFQKVIQTGSPAKTLAQVQPGSGFIWGHVNPAMLSDMMAEAKGTPAESAVASLTGEFVLAGSVTPGGLFAQAGTNDVPGFEALLGMGFDMTKEMVPPSIPDVPGSTILFEKAAIEGGGKTAQGLHIGVGGIPEADVLRQFTGLHLDAWAFAANDVFTFAVGPDKDGIGKLLDVTPGGPSTATLDSLPKTLADGLSRNEVGFIMHMPVDFLHGAQMHQLVRAALKDVPDAQPEQILAMTSLLAPFSSATMWVSKPGATPILHMAVQGIGNRATDEGRAALDAAHTVADGGDPAAAFSSLAAVYAASPMAYAYKTRAGTEGPGYLIGSGLGAVAATAAVMMPLAVGGRNEALADDLGIKPDDPEPVVEVPPTPPARPITEPAKPKPKKDPKPKTDPVKPTTDDPKKDDPIVEPTRPLPPKPTVDPGKKREKKIGVGKKGG